jgi:hypothetical protein
MHPGFKEYAQLLRNLERFVEPEVELDAKNICDPAGRLERLRRDQD